MLKDRARLEAYLDKWRRSTIDYRRFDCVRFVAGWVKETTGADPLKAVPEWRSKASALNVIRSRHERLADWATAILGPCVAPGDAGWGDVAAMPDAPFDCLGIIDGREGIFLSPMGGLKRAPVSRCEFAWVI